MITYEKTFCGANIIVRVDDKLVGHITQVEGGYQYFPKGRGKKIGGEIFPTIKQVKESLEG